MPVSVPAAQAGHVPPLEPVIGLAIGGEARAYPLSILSWHEAVNDIVGGVPVAITFCPLCQSAFAFRRSVGGEILEFGVSGLLWNSNLLLFDRRDDGVPESLWSQVLMRAVSGTAAERGLALELVSSDFVPWRTWKQRYPGTTVLSYRTGWNCDYTYNPYADYLFSPEPLFPVARGRNAKRFPPKEPIVLVSVLGRTKAYAIRDIAAAAGPDGTFDDRFADTALRFFYDPSCGKVRVERIAGANSSYGVAYVSWFAWNAMHPESEVFELPKGQPA